MDIPAHIGDKVRRMPNAKNRLTELILAEYEPRRRRIARAIQKDCGIGRDEISRLTIALKMLHTQSQTHPISDIIGQFLKGETEKCTRTQTSST